MKSFYCILSFFISHEAIDDRVQLFLNDAQANHDGAQLFHIGYYSNPDGVQVFLNRA